ncbi:hypothetical protein ANCCAN_03954 [Ancylostoma caninum]|uniref:Uncharacterized protein n=1 Tax=Ancylostoma caninum TaxID=29170 RepID=A0A368H2C9_ANCCA|nr:hypothetical protein ANCCAN_03954 [Ancylostoma caninum]
MSMYGSFNSFTDGVDIDDDRDISYEEQPIYEVRSGECVTHNDVVANVQESSETRDMSTTRSSDAPLFTRKRPIPTRQMPPENASNDLKERWNAVCANSSLMDASYGESLINLNKRLHFTNATLKALYKRKKLSPLDTVGLIKLTDKCDEQPLLQELVKRIISVSLKVDVVYEEQERLNAVVTSLQKQLNEEARNRAYDEENRHFVTARVREQQNVLIRLDHQIIIDFIVETWRFAGDPLFNDGDLAAKRDVEDGILKSIQFTLKVSAFDVSRRVKSRYGLREKAAKHEGRRELRKWSSEQRQPSASVNEDLDAAPLRSLDDDQLAVFAVKIYHRTSVAQLQRDFRFSALNSTSGIRMPFEKFQAMVNATMNYHGWQETVLCAACGERIVHKNALCYTPQCLLYLKNPGTSVVNKRVTVTSCDAAVQIRQIVERHTKVIVNKHQELHQHRNTRKRRDCRDFHRLRSKLESTNSFRNVMMTIQLLLSMDGFSYQENQKGSTWLTSAKIIDLPPGLKILRENTVLISTVSAGRHPNECEFRTANSEPSLTDRVKGNRSLNDVSYKTSEVFRQISLFNGVHGRPVRTLKNAGCTAFLSAISLAGFCYGTVYGQRGTTTQNYVISFFHRGRISVGEVVFFGITDTEVLMAVHKLDAVSPFREIKTWLRSNEESELLNTYRYMESKNRFWFSVKPLSEIIVTTANNIRGPGFTVQFPSSANTYFFLQET